MKRLLLTSLVAASLATFATSSHAEGIAFITDVKGDVTLNKTRAAIMSALDKGARIACTRDCVVGVMYLQSGKEYTLKGPGDFQIGATEVAAKIGPPPAVRETQWKIKPATVIAAQTASASIRMRAVGAAGSAEVSDSGAYPSKTNVTSLTPLFRWAAPKTGESVRFELAAKDPSRNFSLASTLSASSASYSASTPLAADTEYTWAVKQGAAVLVESSFRTLPAQAVEHLASRKPSESAPFSDRLVYAMTLKDLKADQDARDAFGKLASERPDLKELAALAK